MRTVTRPPGGAELDRILYQIPKDLMESHRLAADVVFARRQIKIQMDGPLARITFYNFPGMGEQGMDIDRS